MSAAIHTLIDLSSGHDLTYHAWSRMSRRGLSPQALRLVLSYGRVVYTRGATIYAIGRKEIARWRDEIDLSDLEGVQAVCGDESVITMYRNRDLRGLRPRTRRPQRRAQHID
jgi:hypothetical protein